MLFVKCLFSRNKNFSNGFQSFFWVFRCIFTGITVTFTFWTTNCFVNHTNTVTFQTFCFRFTIASFTLTRWVVQLLLLEEFCLSNGLLHNLFCFYQTLFAVQLSSLFSLNGGKHGLTVTESQFGGVTLAIDGRGNFIIVLNLKLTRSIRWSFFRPCEIDSFWYFIFIKKFFRLLFQIRVPWRFNRPRWFVIFFNIGLGNLRNFQWGKRCLELFLAVLLRVIFQINKYFLIWFLLTFIFVIWILWI